MNLEDASRWRSTLGRAGALFCIVFLLSGLDGLVAQLRTPPYEYRALPGEALYVNGPCSPDIQSVSQLAYESTTDGIRLQLEGLHSGFWLGGAMWRGQLLVDRGLPAGAYGLVVRSGISPAEKPFSVFVIEVYSDAAALRQASRSFLVRIFGVTPWIVFFAGLLLAALTFFLVYRVSQERDALLAGLGRAEIYRVAAGEGGREVAFGLGSIHGVGAGDLVTLLNQAGERIGKVKVTQVFEADSVGVVEMDLTVKPGFLVTKEI
ncbi:MAG: hypothetical protein MUF52_03960 [Syntrophobacteraceae bacterium]|jgi:hypothetical protein|nr:hypothetical protein [Syntrophobacteraceae bacterium]